MMHEKKFGQKLGNWKFFSFNRSNINRTPIESSRSKLQKTRNFQLIEKQIQLIETLKNRIFWKTRNFFAESIFKRFFMTWNACKWFQKFFKNKVLDFSCQNLNQPSKNFASNITKYIILDGQTRFTHNFMYKA